MLKTLDYLQGKKTYILTLLGVIAAIIGYMSGELTLMEATTAALTAAGVGTMRAGSKNDAKAVIASRPTKDTEFVE